MIKAHLTLLAQLVAADTRTHAEIVAAWNDQARELREDTALSDRQFDRWLAGDVQGLPRAAACRVSEHFFGTSMAELLGPPVDEAQLVGATDPAFSGTLTELRTRVMNSADESSGHAASAARYVDPVMIEDLQDRVRTAAREYAQRSPVDAFAGALRIRDSSYGQLDRTGQPQQEQDLYLVASQICSLLAVSTFDLGYGDAAHQHARAAHVYGRLAGHPTAQAFALAVQCTLAFWSGQPTRGIAYAQAGLDLRPQGTVAVRLHAVAARCWAIKGDRDAAEPSLRAAEEARGGLDPMCDEIGGEFGFSPARSALSAGATFLALGDGRAAATAAQEALSLFAAADPADRWIGGESGARADLIAAHVIGGDLDQAEQQIVTLMDLAPEFRTQRLLQRIRQLQREITARRLHRDPRGDRIATALEAFVVDSLPRALPPAAG